MEIYDQNVLDWNMNSEITCVKDAERIHDTMVSLEFKATWGGMYDMPHYRGEQYFGWDLMPNIFRIGDLATDKAKAKQLEKQGWQEFENVIKANFGNDALRTIFDNEKHGKDWDLLMQAQHASVKTRLLDWSPNVYAPLYFATERNADPKIENSDAQFWVFMVPFESIKSHNDYPVRDTFYDQDPQALSQGCMINVSIFLDELDKRKYEVRMYHQKGRFYVSEDASCHLPLNKQPALQPLLFRFRVPAKFKEPIRNELDARGINYDYLFGSANPAHQALMDSINKKVFGL